MEDLSVKKLPMHLQSSQNRILIKGGTVVNSHGSEKADVYIEDRFIKQVGSNLDIPGGTRVIDASGTKSKFYWLASLEDRVRSGRAACRF